MEEQDKLSRILGEDSERAPEAAAEAAAEEQDAQQAGEELIPKSELNKKNREAQNLRRERNELQKRVDSLEEQLQSRDRREQDQALTKALGLDTRRAPLAAVKTVLDEAEMSPEYGDGGEVLNGVEMRKYLVSVWPAKFGHGSADGGHRQAPGVAPPSMNEFLREEYKDSRGQSRRAG